MKLIMGILNLTPDSFYEPSRYNMAMLDSGADIIDIGACSTRPGYAPVSVEDEWGRLEPVLRMIAEERPELKVSIDTFHSEIVRRAYGILGPFIVNDVSAGDADPLMLDTVAGLGLQYVAMHHEAASDVSQVAEFFGRFMEKAEKAGIEDWILDPGFGFGKEIEDNWAILHSMSSLKRFGRPVLVGLSMKRMTGHSARKTDEANLVALRQGADILRVHDVAAARKVLNGYLEEIQ